MDGLATLWIHETVEWQAAMEALILVVTLGGPTMFARIGVMRALNRHVERVFDPSRKDHHRGRRKLRVIGDELFAVNFGETARTNEATLGAS
jgi:hypothetical protein